MDVIAVPILTSKLRVNGIWYPRVTESPHGVVSSTTGGHAATILVQPNFDSLRRSGFCHGCNKGVVENPSIEWRSSFSTCGKCLYMTGIDTHSTVVANHEFLYVYIRLTINNDRHVCRKCSSPKNIENFGCSHPALRRFFLELMTSYQSINTF